MLRLYVIIALFSYLVSFADAAKILAIFPFPGPSQFICVNTYLQALSERGHELTVISLFPQKKRRPNIHDIILEYPTYGDVIRTAVKLRNDPKQADIFMELFYNATVNVFEHNEFSELLQSKSARFDLIIIEALLLDALYALGEHFHAPLIGVSTFGTDPDIDSLVGNASPPSYLPLVTSSLTDRMSFGQRYQNLQLIFDEWFHIRYTYFPKQNQLYRKYFPHLGTDLRKIHSNFSLILLNQHFSLSFARPYVPAMIEVGGMHIKQKAGELPKEIAKFINEAKYGAIFFSLGSNIRSKDLPEDKLQAILKVFGSLKERILWKFEDVNLPKKPDNVFIRQWFPQSDILAHPKVKLFITHAGLLSTIEAIHYAKPIVGIPIFYDQFLNMERAKVAGYGLGIDYDDLNEHNFGDAIRNVLGNSTFKERVTEISQRYHDQPMKPLDKAIYWTEYVLRHRGARHMRVSAQDLSLIEYFNLDIFASILVALLLMGILLTCILSKLITFLFRNAQSKIKEN